MCAELGPSLTKEGREGGMRADEGKMEGRKAGQKEEWREGIKGRGMEERKTGMNVKKREAKKESFLKSCMMEL